MFAPVARVSPLASRLAAHAWWALLLVALTLLWVASARRIARVEAITNLPTWSVDAPPRDATSPTGYALGQRRLIVPGHHSPSFWWIMEAQQSAAEGSLRLRHIDYDAAPDGREIRRTAPYRWWLMAVGWLHGAVSGEPIGYAIERAALLADPLLLALLLIAGTVYSARQLGSWAATGFVVGGISLFPFAASFQPGAPDHHSLAWLFALGSVLPLLAAFRLDGLGTRRRAHFVAAGVFGGLGFWNDATSQAPVLLAIVLGAMACEFIRSRGAGPQPAASSSWRSWAMAGALTSLAASVFEFAPEHFSWSLDSVNPIHAAAWWGLGEALHATGIWARAGRKVFGPQALAALAFAGVAIASWPVAGILSGSGALLASDFYALELANHPGGGIASNLSAWIDRPGGAGAKWATLLPCVLLVVLLVQSFRATLDREERCRFVFVLVAALVAIILACFQLRWWNLVDVFVLAALTVLFPDGTTTGARTHVRRMGAALLVLPGLFVGFPPRLEENAVKGASPVEVQALIARDFAYWLAKRAGSEPDVLFSTPGFSGAAAFYGGFDVVVSSDDDNETGYLAAVRIASASTEQEVSILLNSRGITRLALPLWDPTMDQFVRIGRNLPAGQPLPPDAFTVALGSWEIPLWMRPMDYLIPNEPHFQGFELRAFALQAGQEPDLGLSRLADFFVERGQLREARSVRESLEAYPRSVFALGAIANVDFALRDSARLRASLEALIPHLSRRAARSLPADRRVALAALLFQTNHHDLAREQLTACLDGLDAGTLRTFNPGTVVNLVSLSRALAIPFPEKSLETVARELIPPEVLARLSLD